MQTPTPKFQEWLAAEREAQVAETELYAAMLAFARDDAPSWLDEKSIKARALRPAAHRNHVVILRMSRKKSRSSIDGTRCTDGA